MHTRALQTQRHTSYAVHVCVSPMYMSSFPHSLYQETRTYIHTCTRTCRYVCIHAAMHACVHAIHHHTHIMCVHVCMYVCIYIHTYIIHTYSHVHSHRREANSCHMGSRIALGVDVLSSFNRYIHVYVCMSTMHKAWMCVRICMYADSLEMHTRNKLRMWACISWHVVDFLPDTCILPVSARSLALCSMA